MGNFNMAPTLAFMQIFFIAAVSEVEFRVGGEIRFAWSWCSFHSPASYMRILFDFKLQPPYKKMDLQVDPFWLDEVSTQLVSPETS